MLNQFSRTELLIGKEGIEKLKNAWIFCGRRAGKSRNRELYLSR